MKKLFTRSALPELTSAVDKANKTSGEEMHIAKSQNNKSVMLYIGILSSISCLLLSGMDDPNSSAQNPYDLVFSEHQHALDTRDLTSNPFSTTNDDEETQQLMHIAFQQISLSERRLFERVKNLFKARSKTTIQETAAVDTIQKLEILADTSNLKNSNSRKNCVLSRFPTLTTSGKVLVAKRLVTFSGISKIRAFQKLIRSFKQTPETVETLRAQLEIIPKSGSEQELLSLCESNSGTYDLIENYIKKRMPNVPIINSRIGTRSIGLANATSYHFRELKGDNCQNHLFSHLLNLFTKGKTNSDAFVMTLQGLIQNKTEAIFAFYEVVKSMATSINNSENTDKPTESLVPNIKRKLDKFLNSDNTLKLVYLKGRLRRVKDRITHLGLCFLMSNHLNLMKDDFLSAYKTIGKLDEILSIIHLMNNSQKPLCFAEFTEEEDATLELDGYWNLLLRDQITTNSITIHPKDPHIVIVAGTNETGKTMAIKANGLCEYLAATVGVVPARACKISKPAKVFTSFNEKDRIASQNEGETSLFQAQVKALKKLVDKAKENPQHSILIIDEPLTATNPKMAECAINAFFQLLSPLKEKTICFLTTHLEEVKQFGKKEPQTYRLMYGHQDFTVNDNNEGACDYSSTEREILAMFSESDSES